MTAVATAAADDGLDLDDYPWTEDTYMAQSVRSQLARERLLAFMARVWRNREPLKVGRHTRTICAKLDAAIDGLAHGRSSYLIVTVPFRHGKSDIVSRHFPGYAMGRRPGLEVMLATYNDDLSHAMSRDARRIVRSEEYQEVFPQAKLGGDVASVKVWSLQNDAGKVRALGIGAGATGHGADVLILDDYFKDRQEAESELIRETRWEAFTNNLMSRLAPVHVVVILATRWHVDDIIGRIIERTTPGSRQYDAAFPVFEVIRFAAKSDEYPGGYLFPERFAPEWYERQFATLGRYASAALLQGDPTLRGGNMIHVEGINLVDEMPRGLHWVRYWDLASTEKELSKSDPDFTVGTKLAVYERADGLDEVYIDDCRWCQAEAPARNRLIYETAVADGAGVKVGVEGVAGYKDAYTTIKAALKGKRVVYKGETSGDKVVRMSFVEPIFDAGRVYMRRAGWNERVIRALAAFPSGSHDDIEDTISGGYELAKRLSRQRVATGETLGGGAI